MSDTLRIGPLDFDINLVDGLTDQDGIRKLNGHIHYDHCKIELEKRLPPQYQWLTLWHEIIHAILTQYSFDLENEERVVDALANGIVEVLQDNPWLKGK